MDYIARGKAVLEVEAYRGLQCPPPSGNQITGKRGKRRRIDWSFSEDGQVRMRPPAAVWQAAKAHLWLLSHLLPFTAAVRLLVQMPHGAERVMKAALRTRGRAAAARTAAAAAGAA